MTLNVKHGIDRGRTRCSLCNLTRKQHTVYLFKVLMLDDHEFVPGLHVCDECNKPIAIGTPRKKIKLRGQDTRYWHEDCEMHV